MEPGAAAGIKLARCALLLALLAVSVQAFMLPRPSKATTTANTAPAAHHLQPLPTAPLAGRGRRRPAAPTSRLGSTPMVDDNSPSDVEAADGSAPSDTSEDVDVVDVAAAEVPATTTTPAGPATGGMGGVGGSVKDELMELIAGGLLDFATPTKRAAVNELLLKLEALNPTQAPAYSPLLNGAWEFLYTGGISPGILGLQLASRLSSVASGAVEVGDTVLTISRAQPRVEVQTSLRVFGRDNNIKIRTRLKPASELRLDETYQEASMGSLRVPFPEQDLFTRPLFVSYLDDDLLVVRDMFGAPDVLIRKDKDFLASYTGVPSATDDDLAPGAG